MERVAGVEPAPSAWKAEVLPLNYTRLTLPVIRISTCTGIAKRPQTVKRQSGHDATPSIAHASHPVRSKAQRPDDTTDYRIPTPIHPSLVEGVGFEPTKA